ncbi:prolipoprotein diacylglyceryl transferase Lgt [Methyloglobulus morosus KoM1]|uniref:Phosphatidylglycerol--prolipoprotein diacylglyceryl transferase n=1 Tax=Methyloglobulus morosus KoM1 TaxID=1116472 RepID=V5BPF0_9GAMM|nr:prolipoprotein diacylglyceryl transferase [Methyloglobulus morosus]ESS69684.1 prolipoprotein diacylglyceryl transferase Lgt [Methyloglobulus morosus KoM1]
MLSYPQIDPVLIAIGPLKIHWYGLMYLIGFAAVWVLGQKRAQLPWSPIKPSAIEDLVTFGAMGVILGGRVGYILFYNFSEFISDPTILFKIWQGGMSFHGGMLGVFVAMWFFGKKQGCTMMQLTDIIAPLAPIGLGAGRIGNFINSELWGRPTDVPWAMVFPNGGPLARHPSQLYEAFLEGVLLFIIMRVYTNKPRPTMGPTGLALFCYGCFRFFVEFYRMPDVQLGYLALDWLTMGQALSTPMIIIGAAMFMWAHKKAA